MVVIIAKIISILVNLIVLLVIMDTLLSYLLSPYHLVRKFIDRVLNPMLAPIRMIVPFVGMFDLIPVILIILVEILSYTITSFLYAL